MAQLDDMSMLLGSDTVVFRSDPVSLDTWRADGGKGQRGGYHAAGTSVRLHDTASSATSLVCIDYWLDSVMSHAEQTALCFHTDGVVQGYRVMPTDALPSGSGLGAHASFSPQAVTASAVSVLRFLRSNCSREAGTYWLVRRPGETTLELYDITDWGGGDGDDGGASGGTDAATGDHGDGAGDSKAASAAEGAGAHAAADSAAGAAAARRSGPKHPFAEPVALLCWRIAERLTQPGEASRRRRLLTSCVRLLADLPRQKPMLAAAAEALADGWLLEAHELMPLPPLDDALGGGAAGCGADDRGDGDGAGGGGGDGRRAAIDAQLAAASALLDGVSALRDVCRPGATPARLLRMLAKLARAETELAIRHIMSRQPSDAVAALRRAGEAHAARAPSAGAVDASDGTERGVMGLLLADACMLVARTETGGGGSAQMAQLREQLADALESDALRLPAWIAAPAAAPPEPASPPPAAQSTAPAAPTPVRRPRGGRSLSPAMTPTHGGPRLSAWAPDGEGNYKLAIGLYLGAIKTVRASALETAQRRLRGAYSELGELYVRADRYTKACRHYQQGIELFRSTSDDAAAAVMAAAFGRALRSRLRSANSANAAPNSPAKTSAWRVPLLTRYAPAAARPAGADADGCGHAAEGGRDHNIGEAMDESELGDYERCVGAFALAQELLGERGRADPLWVEAQIEQGRTLFEQARRLEESLPFAHDELGAVRMASELLERAATALDGASDCAGAGDAHYRLGALHCREHTLSMPRGRPGLGPKTAEAPLLARAQRGFERALELLSAERQPVETLLVRIDLALLHRTVRDACHSETNADKSRAADLGAALSHLLATRHVFGRYSFPLLPAQLSPTPQPPTPPSPPPAPPALHQGDGAARGTRSDAGGSGGGGVTGGGATGGGACGHVAALWPMVESELHATLKELIRLHACGSGTRRGAHAERERERHARLATFYKELFRLSLTRREVHGTGVLLLLAEELARAQFVAADAPPAECAG